MERRADPPISQLMAVTLRTASTEDPVDRVEADMNRFHLSAMPVVNPDGTAFGIISLVDLSHFHAAKKNPKAVRAWELCTYKPISVTSNTSVTQVAKLMLTKRIHHVLVTEGRVLRGIVSTFDFMEQYVKTRKA